MHVIAKASIANSVHACSRLPEQIKSLNSTKSPQPQYALPGLLNLSVTAVLSRDHWQPLSDRRDRLNSAAVPFPLIGHSAEHAIYRLVGLGERGVVWGWNWSYSRGIKLARSKEKQREPTLSWRTTKNAVAMSIPLFSPDLEEDDRHDTTRMLRYAFH